MDSELFTNDTNGGMPTVFAKFDEAKATPGHLRFELIRSLKVFKWILLVLLLILVVYLIAVWAPKKIDEWSTFQNKEGLQYLGASPYVVRGDLENNQDSLAEQAYKKATASTDAFTERMASPEDKELKKIKASVN